MRKTADSICVLVLSIGVIGAPVEAITKSYNEIISHYAFRPESRIIKISQYVPQPNKEEKQDDKTKFIYANLIGSTERVDKEAEKPYLSHA